jgi:hypothetical protein
VNLRSDAEDSGDSTDGTRHRRVEWLWLAEPQRYRVCKSVWRMPVDVSLEKKSLGSLMECFKLKKGTGWNSECRNIPWHVSISLSWTTWVVSSADKNDLSVCDIFYLPRAPSWNRDSLVSTATKLAVGLQMFLSSIPGRIRRFLSPLQHPYRPWGPLNFL